MIKAKCYSRIVQNRINSIQQFIFNKKSNYKQNPFHYDYKSSFMHTYIYVKLNSLFWITSI